MMNIHPLLTIHYWINSTLWPLVSKMEERETQQGDMLSYEMATTIVEEKAMSYKQIQSL